MVFVIQINIYRNTRTRVLNNRVDDAILILIVAVIICVAQTSSAENAYTVNGNTVYCPDGCSIRGPTSISASTSKEDLLNNCVCTCDGVQSQCSEKRITSGSVAIRGGIVAVLLFA
eukprot:jgi/Picre1/27437/NNA_000404.t1